MELPDKSAPVVGPKEIKPVISGVVQVKRPASRRFKDFLMAESPKVLLARIARDVLVPRAKAGLEEAAQAYISGMFWGDSANRPISNIVRGTVMRGGGINYAGISSPSTMAQAMQASHRPSGNYQDLVCGSQQQAETLLANMYELLRSYHVVAVGDLYELAGIPSNQIRISDNGYGWTSLEGARISKVREGYLLELPRPTLIGS